MFLSVIMINDVVSLNYKILLIKIFLTLNCNEIHVYLPKHLEL